MIAGGTHVRKNPACQRRLGARLPRLVVGARAGQAEQFRAAHDFVEEIDYMPALIEEVREETGTAARRFHSVLQRARAMAQEQNVKLHTHVVAGHPVRDIVGLASELKVDLLVIGAKGHSALYERMIGSRADRI